MVEHMHIPRKYSIWRQPHIFPALSCSSKETNTGIHYLSAPREEVQGSPHSWTIDDSRCRDMPVVCSDWTYVRTGTMLKETGIQQWWPQFEPFLGLLLKKTLLQACCRRWPYSIWAMTSIKTPQSRINLVCRSRTGGSILMCQRTLPRVTGKEGPCLLIAEKQATIHP